MIRSMTGYGQATLESEALRAAVSVRSLNHRFLEVGLNLPRRVQPLEAEVKGIVQSRLARGKVDLTLRASFPEAAVLVVAQPGVIDGAVTALRAARDRHGLPGDVALSDLARFPGAFEVVEEPGGLGEASRRSVLSLVASALDGLEAMRLSEGARLAAELARLIDGIEAVTSEIEGLHETGKTARRETLVLKLRELLRDLGLEDPRFFAEVVRAADRMDASEEIQRLRSHVALARELLAAREPQGKRLDFVAQEMLREANTLGSKAAHAPLSHAVIGLKAEIEKLREQAQNVE